MKVKKKYCIAASQKHYIPTVHEMSIRRISQCGQWTHFWAARGHMQVRPDRGSTLHQIYTSTHVDVENNFREYAVALVTRQTNSYINEPETKKQVMWCYCSS